MMDARRARIRKSFSACMAMLLGVTFCLTSCNSPSEEEPKSLVDFTVEVENSQPTILQLTDTQVQVQVREGETGDPNMLNLENMEAVCFQYIRQAIERTNPDLILLTGDNTYGKYDDDGNGFEELVEFMDSFQIPWSPVFGNHDAECILGVDWQCSLLEESEYCLFKQRELSGNGNYTVGITYQGQLIRVFYMVDTNGNAQMSSESMLNGHTVKGNGLQYDQIEWFEEDIKKVKEGSPNTKFSVAMHIPPLIFNKALERYGFNEDIADDKTNPFIINLDTFTETAEGDFGYIAATDTWKFWDERYEFWNIMKNNGVDSIFAGHNHVNSASIVYEGVRLSYGLKTGLYDQANYRLTDGTIKGSWNWSEGDPIVGGTVIKLSQDGTIENTYHAYHEKNT